MKSRYQRQLLLSEIGEEGQEKLRRARVLIVGVGGLGSPIALYLCGAGVGTIGLVDDDTVSLSNLHRQILYTEAEVGMPKAVCAARHLRTLNSQVTIIPHPVRLIDENVHQFISQYDVVVDGCDNFRTRYLLSDTCHALHIPYIYGAVTEFTGQVAILCHGDTGKTYRDLFPDEEKLSALQEKINVVGTTPAIVGIVEANETLKLTCGYGQPLIDSLWTIDLRTMQSQVITL